MAADGVESVELRELLKLFPSNGLAKAFQKFDKDNSGALDRDELAAALKTLPKPKTVSGGKKKSIDELFAEMDTDGNGTIDPEEWAKNMPEGLKASIVEAVLAEAERPAPEPVKCSLKEMPDEVEKAIKIGLTPIVVDPSGAVETLYGYKAICLDAKMYSVQIMFKKKTLEECLDDARKVVYGALVNRRPLVIQCRSAVPDFKGKFGGPSTLPQELFLGAGKALLMDPAKMQAFFKDTDDEKEGKQQAEHHVDESQFAVIVTSALEGDGWKEHLLEGEGRLPGPSNGYQPILVQA